jgi:hypothetical protein
MGGKVTPSPPVGRPDPIDESVLEGLRHLHPEHRPDVTKNVVMHAAKRSAILSRRSTAPSNNIPPSEVRRPPSKPICTGLPASAGKPGKIPVLSAMAGANSVGFGLIGLSNQIIHESSSLRRSRQSLHAT